MDDIYGHLTNTARAAEDIHFDEAKFVRVSSVFVLWCFQWYLEAV